MAKANTASNAILLLLFNATTWATVAINASSSPITNIETALHTADPGAGGNQTTSEAAYTSYARVPVVRTSSGWTVTSQSVSPVANIDFPAGTGGSGTGTFFSVGTAHTSTGALLYSGTITPNITFGNGVTPRLTTATAVTES